MEIAKRFTREELEGIAHEQYLREFPRGQAPAVRFANVRPVLGLSGAQYVFSRGKIWEVPPIPLPHAIRLLEIRQGLDELQDVPASAENIARYAELCTDAVKLFPKLVKPQARGLKRLLWRLGWRPNPWTEASEEEVNEVLGFFWRSRMRSPGRGLAGGGARGR